MENIKRDFKAAIKWLDSNKYKIHSKGIAFKLTALYPSGEVQDAGIGEWGEMCLMTLAQLYANYQVTQTDTGSKPTPEAFMESVTKTFMEYKKDREASGTSGEITVYLPEEEK